MQLDKSDGLYEVKGWLLGRLGIATPAKWQALDLQTCAAGARVLSLRQGELKQLRSVADLQQCINPRNEAAALALLVANQQGVCGNSAERQQQLQQLLATYPQGPAAAAAAAPAMDGSTAQPKEPAAAASECSYDEDSPEQQLFEWITSKGVATQLKPASFGNSSSSSEAAGGSDGAAASIDSSSNSSTTDAAAPSSSSSSSDGLRGCAAVADIPAGSTAVSLPSKLLMSYKTAADSEFGAVLNRLGLDPETLTVVWTMVDRWDAESDAQPFWQALPERFSTGISVPEPLVDLMKGLQEHIEFKRARQHVRGQFEPLQQIFTVLLTAYAAHLQPEWFTEAAYLWAVELWYAYAIQVKFPDCTIQPALAPFVSLINHSPWPHIVHFSTVNPKTRTLDLTTFRPVQQGQQVFLSYGPLPNAQLLLFYGFAVEGNPFEEAILTVQWPSQQQQQQQGAGSKEAALGLLRQLGLWPQQQQQQQQLTLTVQQPLPAGLLPCLRLMSATAEELTAVQQSLLQYSQQQQGSSAVSGSSSSNGGKATNRSKQAGKGNSRSKQCISSSSSSSSSEEGPRTPAELQAAWEAAATWQAVLGTPLSITNEAAAQQQLQQLLTAAKQPYKACLAKIAKRRQLQALLQQRQQQQGAAGSAAGSGSSSSSSEEASFLQGLETLCKGLVGLYDVCGAAAAALAAS